MRIETQSKVFVFRSVIEDERAQTRGASQVTPSPAMAAAMAWSTPLPLAPSSLAAPTTATCIRPLPLADLRMLAAYASEPPQLRDASSIPPPPVAPSATKPARAERAPKAASTSGVREPGRRISSLVHTLTLAAPYAAALLVFGVAQAKWASDAWTGMREHDASALFGTRTPRPAPVIDPVVAPPLAPLTQAARIAAEDVAPEISSSQSDDAVGTARGPRGSRPGARTTPSRPTATPGSAPRGSR